MYTSIIPAWERCLYWVMGVCGIAYTWWRVWVEIDALIPPNDFEDFGLQRNWNIFARKQDITDSEWSLLKKYISKILVLNLIHILLSQTFRALKAHVKIWTFVMVLCDLTCLLWLYGHRAVLIWILKTSLFYFAATFGGVYGVWAVTIPLLFSHHWKWDDMKRSLLGMPHFDFYILFFVADCFLLTRLVSFGLHKAKFHNSRRQRESRKKDDMKDYNTAQQEDEDDSFSLLEALLYLFYLPSFIIGPIHIYPEFTQQIKHNFIVTCKASSVPVTERARDENIKATDKDNLRFSSIFMNLARVSLWACFLEFCQHIFYFSALRYNQMADRLPSLWSAFGVAHVTGQFFMVKNVVMYGFFGQLGRFDGVTPPPEPRCISWVYSYTDMWKYFDAGLYKFVKHFIFIPLGGSRYGLFNQMAASGVTFLFIYLWHGGTWPIFIWCFGNFAIGILEAMLGVLKRSSLGQRLVAAIGHAMILRLECLLISCAWLVSSLQAMLFLMNEHEAWVIYRRTIITATWMEFLTLIGIIYACVQNAMFLRECKVLHWKRKFSTCPF